MSRPTVPLLLATLVLAGCGDRAQDPLLLELQALRQSLTAREGPPPGGVQAALAPLKDVLEELLAEQERSRQRQGELSEALRQVASRQEAGGVGVAPLQELQARLTRLEEDLEAQDARHAETELLLQRALQGAVQKLDIFLKTLQSVQGGDEPAGGSAPDARDAAGDPLLPWLLFLALVVAASFLWRLWPKRRQVVRSAPLRAEPEQVVEVPLPVLATGGDDQGMTALAARVGDAAAQAVGEAEDAVAALGAEVHGAVPGPELPAAPPSPGEDEESPVVEFLGVDEAGVVTTEDTLTSVHLPGLAPGIVEARLPAALAGEPWVVAFPCPRPEARDDGCSVALRFLPETPEGERIRIAIRLRDTLTGSG